MGRKVMEYWSMDKKRAFKKTVIRDPLSSCIAIIWNKCILEKDNI